MKKSYEIKVNVTNDYSRFVVESRNRTIKKKHVETIKRQMEKMDFHKMQPIYVTSLKNGELVVIDGQHRLMAREALGREVCFICDENSYKNINDIPEAIFHLTNQASKTTINDHIEMARKSKNKFILEADKLLKPYPYDYKAMLAILICGNPGSTHQIRNNLKDGSLRIKHLKKFRRFINFMEVFDKHIKKANKNWIKKAHYLRGIHMALTACENNSSKMTRVVKNKKKLESLHMISKELILELLTSTN